MEAMRTKLGEFAEKCTTAEDVAGCVDVGLAQLALQEGGVVYEGRLRSERLMQQRE